MRSAHVSRRAFLGGVGALGAGAAIGGCASDTPAGGPAARTVGFHGRHQGGIATPAQDRLTFATFDLTTTSRRELVDLLRTWTAAAAAMTNGRLVPGGESNPAAPPADTGEAVGLPPARLTLTLGFGSSLFDNRFGLAARRPAALEPLPPLPGDELQPARTGGDIAIQACADDPQITFHAIRNLARLAQGAAVLRWTQLGFGRTSSTSSNQQTLRNLMGFKDGTRNIKADSEPAAMNRFVWVGSETDQPWMRGGSYLVARRIRMTIEAWDRDFLADQENVFGRYKASGAPLTGHGEFDRPDFTARDGAGRLVIPADAHVRLAAFENNRGVRILRRGYSYTDGIDPRTGELDAGLFFICFNRNAHEQFVPLQRKLGVHDALNEYISHTGGGLFACPPGVEENGFWGDGLVA